MPVLLIAIELGLSSPKLLKVNHSSSSTSQASDNLAADQVAGLLSRFYKLCKSFFCGLFKLNVRC